MAKETGTQKLKRYGKNAAYTAGSGMGISFWPKIFMVPDVGRVSSLAWIAWNFRMNFYAKS